MSTPVVNTKLEKRRHIVINRPEVRNSLNQAVLDELEKAFDSARTDRDCRVILLYGQGEAAFCSGADLRELDGTSDLAEREKFFGRLAAVIRAMHRCPQPIIAKVHGFALAGGLGLIAASDIVLASADAQFGLPEAKIGLIPGVVMTPLHRAVGRRALAELALCAGTIGAERAKEIGLVTRVHSKESLDAEAQRLAQEICALAPQALAASKKLLLEVSEGEYDRLLTVAAKTVAQVSMSDEAREGISAFLAKRSPPWRR